jgi:hypothetical protein
LLTELVTEFITNTESDKCTSYYTKIGQSELLKLEHIENKIKNLIEQWSPEYKHHKTNAKEVKNFRYKLTTPM